MVMHDIWCPAQLLLWFAFRNFWGINCVQLMMGCWWGIHLTFVCWNNGFIDWGIELYCCWVAMPKCKAVWSSWTRFLIVYVVEWWCQNECISSMFTKVYCLITHDVDQSRRPKNHNMNNGKFSHKWNWMTCLLIEGLSPKMELIQLGGCVEMVRGGGQREWGKNVRSKIVMLEITYAISGYLAF